MQPAAYVGPGQVAWFQFTIQAPVVPGYYRLYLRPLVEDATWMEDYGVFWLVTVLNPDGSRPPTPPAVYSGTGYNRINVPTSAGTFTTYLIKERLSQVRVKTVTANTTDCFSACPAKPLAQYVAENGAYAAIHGSYFCPPDYAPCASKVNTYDYAVYNSAIGAWINPRHLANPTNALATFNGNTATFYRRTFSYARGPGDCGHQQLPAAPAERRGRGHLRGHRCEPAAARRSWRDRRRRDVRVSRDRVRRLRAGDRARPSGARRA